jgi:hypothetical protein
VTDFDARIKRCQRRSHAGSGIAVHQHHIGAVSFEQIAQPRQDARGDIGEVLACLHDIEVKVGGKLKKPKHLVEHLAVLSGHTEFVFKVGILGELPHQNGHFDGFGASTKYSKDFQN